MFLKKGLDISRDYRLNPKTFFPVLLFIPNPLSDDHFHIPLSKRAARKLRDWLNEYLDDRGKNE
jgi:hypothetical protein